MGMSITVHGRSPAGVIHADELTACGRSRANVTLWTNELSEVTCRRCLQVLRPSSTPATLTRLPLDSMRNAVAQGPGTYRVEGWHAMCQRLVEAADGLGPAVECHPEDHACVEGVGPCRNHIDVIALLNERDQTTARLSAAERLVHAFSDHEDAGCRIDHNGTCQVHNGELDGVCLIVAARTFLAGEAPVAEPEGFPTTRNYEIDRMEVRQDIGTHEPHYKRVVLVFWNSGDVTWEAVK